MVRECKNEGVMLVELTGESQAGLLHELGRYLSENDRVLVSANFDAESIGPDGKIVPPDQPIVLDAEVEYLVSAYVI